MNLSKSLAALGLLATSLANAQSLYYSSGDPDENRPIKWVGGLNLIYDDNVAPGFVDYDPVTGVGTKVEDSSFGLNPFVGATFTSLSPQTTWDVYARLGLIYYADAPDYLNEVSSQSRLGINMTHRFSERLRWVSRNFISYELEPDYSYGYSSSRATGEYLYWTVDNALGYRWTQRLATYTGFRFYGTTYPDLDNNDRTSWELYNQFRYQLTPQTVGTFEYRFGQTYGSGLSSDSTEQYVLGGLEHRFSANSIGILTAGAQIRDVDDGEDNVGPFLQAAFNSQVNEQFRIRSFARYGMESYGSVLSLDLVAPFTGLPETLVEYDARETFRLGVTGEYDFSEKFGAYAGLDYIPTLFNSGRWIQQDPAEANPGAIPDIDESIVNAYIGLSMRFADNVVGTLTYSFTQSTSDIDANDYDRNRISVGVSAEF